MPRYNPFDFEKLAAQVVRQRKHAFDLNADIPWQVPIDYTRFLLPLDSDAIAFPGAAPEQRLALSQLMGLIINSTIAEMESVIHVLRHDAWTKPLRAYPANPEMWELGDLFFEEENKHALVFNRYNRLFCEQAGLDPEQVDRLLPKAFGSWFLHAIRANARSGGTAFWWVVASVEEVSLELFRQIQKDKNGVEPLYLTVHKRHAEEEARHHNYAFLMLELLSQKNVGLAQRLRRKTDLLFAQVFSTGWVLSELHRIFEVKGMRSDHPFYETLAGCLPLFDKVPLSTLLQKLFVSAPYVGLVLNTKNHKKTHQLSQTLGMLSAPFPEPALNETLLNENAA